MLHRLNYIPIIIGFVKLLTVLLQLHSNPNSCQRMPSYFLLGSYFLLAPLLKSTPSHSSQPGFHRILDTFEGCFVTYYNYFNYKFWQKFQNKSYLRLLYEFEEMELEAEALFPYTDFLNRLVLLSHVYGEGRRIVNGSERGRMAERRKTDPLTISRYSLCYVHIIDERNAAYTVLDSQLNLFDRQRITQGFLLVCNMRPQHLTASDISLEMEFLNWRYLYDILRYDTEGELVLVVISPHMEAAFACLLCKENSVKYGTYVKPPVSSVPFKALDVGSLRQLWVIKVHKDLGGHLIWDRQECSNYIRNSNSKTERCSMYKSRYSSEDWTPLRAFCPLPTIARSLNFSFGYGNRRAVRFSQITLDCQMSQRIAGQMEENSLSVVSFGLELELYGLMVIVDRSLLEQSLDALIFAPFNWWVWLEILALCTGVALVIALKMELRFLKITALFRNIFDLIMLAIEQGSSGRLAIIARKALMSKTQFMMWAIFCLIVRELYRGSMFSELSSEPDPPWVPRSIESLVESKLVVGTFMSISKLEDNSGLTEMLSDNYSRSDSFWKLGKTLTKFHNIIGYTLPNFAFYSAIHRRHVFGGLSASKKFALVDRMENLNLMKELLGMPSLGNGKWVSRPSPEHRLVSRKFILVQGNFLFPILKNGFARLHESGLPNKWIEYDKWHTDRNEVRMLNNLAKLIPRFKGTVPASRYKGSVFIPDEVFSQFWGYYALAVSVCWVILVMELCIHGRSSFLKQLRDKTQKYLKYSKLNCESYCSRKIKFIRMNLLRAK